MSDETTPRTPETIDDETIAQDATDAPAGDAAAEDLGDEGARVQGECDKPAQGEDAAPVAPDTDAVTDASANLPSFLAHADVSGSIDDEPNDDPTPLNQNFQVIDGGTDVWDALDIENPTETKAPGTAEQSTPASQQGKPTATTGKDLATSAAGAVNAVGSFIAQGATAVREMNAAKKALAEARGELAAVQKRVDEQSEELKRRRTIEQNYDAIIEQEQNAKLNAQKAQAAAEAQRDSIQAAIDKLKAQLETVREDDAQTEKRLKAALDAAEAKEASSREAGKRLTRRLDDAKRMQAKAEEERKTGVEAVQATIDSAQARLKTLREEYAEIQRNPSLNSANYSIRTSELNNEISDASDELRKATEDLPRVKAELEQTLATARKAVEAATEPINEAKRAHQAVTDAADAARADYQSAREASMERQRALREQIAAQEKAQRAQIDALKQATEDAQTAQSHIDEAADVHEHPEATETLAGALERDRHELSEQTAEVQKLEAAEQRVRANTHDSRVKFLGAIAVVVAIIVVAVIAWLILK